jgi:hypothetical protein
LDPTGLQDNAGFTPFAERPNVASAFAPRATANKPGYESTHAAAHGALRIFEPVLDCRYSAAASSRTKPATRDGDIQACSRLSCLLCGDT